MKTLLPLSENYFFILRSKRKWFNNLFLIILALLCCQVIYGQSSQTFNASGTFTVPSGVTSLTVECWGGGGRGGTRTTNGVGGGGGGGGYSRSVIAVTPGAPYSVNVGAGSTSTAAGGDSWFGSTSTVMAKGGTSSQNNSATAGTGGLASQGVGTVKFSGGDGRVGNTSGTDFGGGGGSSAGIGGNGNNATNQNGAPAPVGGGDGGSGRYSSQGDGSSGSAPGGGGGGALRTISGTRNGGNGANGQVIVSWVPAYVAQFISMNTGSSTWCPGETRTVTVTVKNAGQATWTNAVPDINIGVKWNGDPDYLVRTNANDLAPGATGTYSLTVIAPATPSTNNLTFDVVNEGDCWFGNNNGSCGPGNAVFTSSQINIGTAPAIVAHPSLTNRTYCAGAATAALSVSASGSNLSYQWYSNTVASNVGGTLIPGATSATYLPSSAVPGTQYYYVVVTGCSPQITSNVSGSYTINDNGTLALTSAPSSQNQTLCFGNPIENISLITGGAATGVFISSGALPPGLTDNFTAGVYTISGTPTVAGNYSFTVQTTGSLCNNPSISFNIVVQALPTLAQSSAIGSETQTVCVDTPISDIVYLVGGGAVGANVSGLPAGINTSLAAGILTLSGSPAVAGTYNFEVITTGPACTNLSLFGSITVGDNGSLVLTSAPSTTNQLVCEGSPVTDIQYQIGGTATGAQITSGSLPSGVSGVFSGGVFSISGIPTTSGVFNYTVSATGSPCVNPSLSGTIIVNTPGTIAQASPPGTESQTLCINNAMSNLEFAIGGGATGALITSGTLPAGVSGSYSAGVFTVSGTPTATGVFNFSITTTGGCTNETVSAAITVQNNAFISLSSSTTSPVNCINTPVTSISFAVSGSATGALITAGVLPAGLTATYSSGTFTISGTATESGVFPYTVTTSGPCLNASISGTITINANGTIVLTSPGADNQTVCVNNVITPVTYAVGGGATGASLSAGSLPAGVTGIFSSGVFTISGTPSVSGTFNFTIRATGPCVQPTLTGVIVAEANSTINLSSGFGTNNRIVCVNTAMPSITWTVGGSATGATVTGLPAGIAGTYNPALKQFTLSGNPTIAGSFAYTVTTTGPCVNVSGTGTITVNSDATITLTSGAGSNSQTVCVSQQAIAPITYLIGGSGTGATVTGLPAGITGSYNAGSKLLTISGTPTASGTFNFTVTTTGPCIKPALTGTIIVNARPVANAITGTNSVCVTESITLTPNASGTAPLSYAWSSSNPAVASVNNAGVVTGISSGTTNISYTVTNGFGCTQTSPTFAVTVRPSPTGTLTAAENSGAANNDNTICAGSNITFTATPGFVIYHFKVNGTTVQNGTANVFNSTTLANSDVVTVDVTNSSSCTVTFNPVAIVVNPVPAGSLSASESSGVPNDNLICSGDNVTFTATAGFTNYVFLVNGAGVQSGASNTFSTTTLSGTASVTVEVTNSNNCKVTWGPQVITVNGLPAGALSAAENSGTTPNNNEICAGDAVTFTATAGFTNYNFIVNGSSMQNGAANTFVSSSLTNPSIVTVQATNAGGCAANFTPVIISVNDLPAGTLSGAENSGVVNDMIICAGETVAFTATPGFAQYTFKLNGGTVQSGVLNSYSTTSLLNGDVISVEVLGDGGCSTIFNTVTVTVDPLPSAALVANENSGTPDDNVICAGENISFTASAGYANYSFLVNGNVVQNGISNLFSTTSLADNDVVSVVVSAANGCISTSAGIVVTVSALPAGTLSLSENSGMTPNDGVICAGDAVTFTASAGYNAYVFYVNGVAMQNGSSNVFTTSSLTNGASVTVEAFNTTGCSQVYNNFLITVNALPTVTINATENSGVTNDGTICPGEQVTFTAAPGFVNYNFRVNGISVQSSASSTFTTTSVNATSTIDVEVTNASGCNNISSGVTITVNALPVGTINAVENSGIAPNDNAICTGASVAFSATAGYASYDFLVNGISEQSGASEVFTTSTLADGDEVSVIVGHTNGCSTTFPAVQISVYAYPVVPAISGNAGLCVGATTVLANTVGGGTWSGDNDAVATVDAITGIVTGIAAGNVNISYTVTNAGGCPTAVLKPVEVFALPVPTLSGPNPFCPETISEYQTEPGQFNYVWTVTGGTILSGGTSTDNSVMVDWNLPGVKSIFVNYTNANGCAGATSTTVTGSTGVIPVLGGANQVCNNTTGVVYTTQAGYLGYDWSVTGGIITGGGTTSDNFATITWTVPGTGSVSVNFSDLNGCTAAAPTVRPVYVRPLPTATVSGSSEACQNAASPNITFTGAGGVSPYTFTYQVNGGAVQSVTTVSGNSVQVPVSTSATGSFTYSLVDVTGANGCGQTQSGSATVTINPLPGASISGTTSVCRGGSAALTFTGVNGTLPYTFTYTINGGAPQFVSTISGNSVIVPVNTSNAGVYTYALTQVSDMNGCAAVASGSAVITVNELPTATISGDANICINAAPPVITFTGSNGIAPYTFSYNINGGPTQTVISTGNVATVLAPTNVAGSFVYNLTSVSDASATICGQIQSGNISVNVSPSSVGGTLSGSTSVCTLTNSTLLTLTGYTGTITGWESSNDGGATWLPITNTTANYTATGLFQTTQYRVLVQSGSCTVANSTVATITVMGVSAGGTVSGSATVCAGANSGGLTLTGHSGAILRWESSVNGGASWSAIANTTTGLTYTNIVQTTHYRAIVANSPCAEAASTPAVITVNARPTAVLSGTGNMCLGAGHTLALTVTGSGTISGTLSGGIPFSGTAPAINVNVNPSGTTAYTITSLNDANCTALPANLSGSATVTVLPLPAVFTVSPATATMCQGTVTALTATGSVPTNGTASASSGTVNLSIPDANLFGGTGVRTHGLDISGIPAGAVITTVSVNFNIPHTATGELDINLRAPNGNVLNLVGRRGGSGNNFTNTTINNTSSLAISGASAPFTNTYAPDAINNTGPAGYVSNVGSFNGLMSVPNGTWTIVAEDNVFWSGFFNTNTGSLSSWSITINYTVPSNLPSTWSPLTGLYTDPGATTAYAGQALTTVYASPAAGNHVYTATYANAQGCERTATAALTVNAAPVVTIVADYCAIPGKIQLTANSSPAATGYLWNTGATTQSIAVDEAGTYDVTVTTALGCPGRATTFIAQELVVNGDFEAGNTGFFTEYTPATGFNLYPEGEYAVGTDAHLYHDAFYGKDHTTAAQTGNFMMINGSSTLIGSPGRLRTIWQQTVTVLPNTDYYFSAWAMNLNPGSPARLQFEVNGVPVGTIADLNTAPKPTSQAQVNINNWVRFYSNPTWNSGVNTTAVIRIINLNTDPGGNDFGLDDISFGTLKPFITLVSAPGTDAQTLCVNTPITNVVYSVAGGASGPTVTGLPAGVVSTYNGTTVTLSGTPTVAGTFGYSITTTGTCNPVTVTGTLTVEQQTIVLSSGSGAQNACTGSPISPVQFTLGGTATGATVSGLPAGVTGSVSGVILTISGTPSAEGLFTYTVTTTGTCQPVSTTGSINVRAQTIALFSGNTAQVRCVNSAISNIVYTTGGTATGATVTGLPPGVTGNFSGGIFIISGTPTLAGTYNYTVTTNGTCNPASLSGSIQVNPAATIALTSGAGSNTQTVCVNSSISPITYSISGGGTGATVSGLPAGLTGTYSGGTLTISGAASLVGTYSYTVTTTGTCAQVTANGSITVQGATVVLSSGTANQTVCNSTSVGNIVYAIGGTATGAVAANLPPGVTGSYAGGYFTISGTPTVAGTYNFTVTSTGSCAGVSAGGTIIVGVGSIGGSLPSVYVCLNSGGVLTLTGHSGNIVRWESSTNGGATWTNIANVTSAHTYSNITSLTQFRVRVQSGSCPATYSSVGSVGVQNMWTGTVSSDWFDAGNWTGNTLPSMTCEDVIIPVVSTPNVYPVLTSGTASIHNINIQAGASLTVNGGTLEIAGSINNNGTFDVQTGTINMNGTEAQVIPANAFASNSLGHLLVGNSHPAGLSIDGPLNILGSLKFTTAGTRLNTGNVLTMKSTAAKTAWVGNLTGKIIDGEVTVERYIHTGTGAGMHPKSWQLLAVPTFGSQTVNEAWQEGSAFPNQNNVPGYGTMMTSNLPGAVSLGFDAQTPAGGTVKTYNANTYNWDGIPSTNALPINNPNGYMVLVRGDRSVFTSAAAAVPTILRTTGKLYTTGADAPPAVMVPSGKFGSVGNPYASAIDLTSSGIDRENLADVYYVWDPQLTTLGSNSSYGLGAYQTLTLGMDGNYHVTPGGGSYGAGGSIRNTIESGQAFMVLSSGGLGRIEFSEDAKVEGSNLVSRASVLPESEIRTNLYVMHNGYQVLLDGVASQFNEAYSSEVDIKDALKLGNMSENFSIARGGKLLAVEQRRPASATDTIYFNLGQVRQQQYKLEFNPSNMVAPGLSAWLEDTYLNTSMPVSLENSTAISFSVQSNAPGSYAANRFRLVFRQVMAPLPVTIVTVGATRNSDASVNVKWEVENETSIEKYEVERSESGRNFTGIITEGPRANNGGQATYQRTDLSALKQANFYRIKAISRNGLVQYSSIVKVDEIATQGTIAVYPNPVINKTLNVKFSSLDAGKYNLVVFNSAGKTVVRNVVELGSANLTRSFQLGNLAAGIYHLVLQDDAGKKWQSTFLVQ